MTATPVIEIHGVDFAYSGRPVLSEVNLTVGDREFLCVVGPNGGGKTTLLKLMLGLIQPHRGSVRMLGMDPIAARDDIGYMPQESHFDRLFPAGVLDVVLMGRLHRGMRLPHYDRADRAAARDALNKVDLSAKARHSYASLSGGQRQRVLLARALACRPKILLLDEPTASLDVAIQDDLHQLLHRLNETMTIVLVSHDFAFVTHAATSVVCVKEKVEVHPTEALTGELIGSLFGRDVRMVRHDHAYKGLEHP